jgi:hypothetical protein
MVMRTGAAEEGQDFAGAVAGGVVQATLVQVFQQLAEGVEHDHGRAVGAVQGFKLPS